MLKKLGRGHGHLVILSGWDMCSCDARNSSLGIMIGPVYYIDQFIEGKGDQETGLCYFRRHGRGGGDVVVQLKKDPVGYMLGIP